MDYSSDCVTASLVVLLLGCFCLDFGAAIDTITVSRPIRDHETIISSGGAFKFGFFSPSSSSKRYVGIRYNDESEGVVWVANRNSPLSDKSGVVTISEDGNLVVLNGWNQVVWKSNALTSAANAIAKLSDSGNLVLLRGNSGEIMWESFHEPGDTFRSTMKMSTNVTSSYSGTECEKYNRCGAFRTCDKKKQVSCSCLKGFLPMNAEEWSRGNSAGGCVRRRLLQCERISKTGVVGKADEFWKLKMMKVPDFAEMSSVPEVRCKEKCLNNCSCIAYAYDAGIGCMTWRDRLIDVQKLSSGGTDLFIRLAHAEFEKKDMKVVIIVSVVVGVVSIAIGLLFLWWLMAKRKARTKDKMLQLQDLPVFNFEKLANATDNFSLANKLGQGGFGPVYKGTLQDGHEIAVKRLSKSSGQGLEEFMNEVTVISKLQHRNLVRLLGCCIKREEKMLVYEYMPNKSLDALLFDPSKQELLDWKKRFNIIDGVSRGLVYLHRDSRLRIIHRDLKASNILLDEELNPKISDFGMARIFFGDQDALNTRRVVGTYGYMSPEYAMGGQFSEKSDVFSFGVLLLEIVSGKRNTGFYEDENALTLLGFAWKLWNENNISALVDPVISDLSFQSDIFRCIQVGLLCVQEFVKDRPTMPIVVSMLNSVIVDLPKPKQPAFTARQNTLDTESSEQSQKNCSVNYVTVSVVKAR